MEYPNGWGVEAVDSEHPIDFGSVSFSLPDDTPPTSQGELAIGWTLKLHGVIAYWPDAAEEYEIRVPPSTDGE